MNPAVARLLHRLTSLATTTTAFASSHDAITTVVRSTNPSLDDSKESRLDTTISTPKLVYGAARQGAVQLASHASHSSHSSHASHASHASHYSSSGSESAPAYTPPPPASPPPTAQKPAESKPEARNIASEVLAKLPKLQSHWPKELQLTKRTFFNIYDGGKVVGMTTLDAGAILQLVEVKPQHVVVRVGSSTSPVPVENTDLVERMGGEEDVLSLADDPQRQVTPPPESSKPAAPATPKTEPAKP